MEGFLVGRTYRMMEEEPLLVAQYMSYCSTSFLQSSHRKTWSRVSEVEGIGRLVGGVFVT